MIVNIYIPTIISIRVEQFQNPRLFIGTGMSSLLHERFAHVQNVIATDQNIAKFASTYTIDPLLCATQLEVHIAISADKDA